MFGSLFKSGLGGTIGAIFGAGVGHLFQQRDALKEQMAAQELAQKQAREDAEKAANLADQAMNKANRKAPDISALLAGNALTKGVGSTMLTGPGGVSPNALTLGRNQLLGS